ncbi:MAG: hypothetical protein K2W96_25605 [Gemmataceae bacterium]|nr:hypothetical protein [Gemmataceae bacterium]
MYTVDDLDAVQELADTPRPDIGAPLPRFLADEGHLVLAYLASDPDPKWDGGGISIVGPGTEGEAVVLVRFRWPTAHFFGPPNDEAFSGHPLAARGLRPYRVFEVGQSSWIRRLERMNSVHPHHDKERFLARRRHFVFAFHDSTFECIAEGFVAETVRGSMRSVLPRMAELLEEPHQAVERP